MRYRKDINNYTAAKLFVQDSVIPLDSYPGRKAAAGAWQKILSEIPRCNLFIEAMCGSAFLSSIINVQNIVINDRDRSVIDKLRYAADNVEFRNEDYKCIIARYDNGNKERVFYFDPPYMMNTRSYQLPIYKFDWKPADHTRFIKAMLKMKCPTMISHYPCPLYDNAFKSWRKITYNSMTRAGVREESLYMNFPQPVLLQQYAHVGENFTDRQRIKRKVARLVAKLQKEQPQERAAILSAVIDNFSYIRSEKNP